MTTNREKYLKLIWLESTESPDGLPKMAMNGQDNLPFLGGTRTNDVWFKI